MAGYQHTPSVAEAVQYVQEFILTFDSTAAKKPPIMISSLARSGKTTFLAKIFDALQATGNYRVIMISLSGNFALNNNETPRDGILRLIATQLMIPGPTNNLANVDFQNIHCSEAVLNEKLSQDHPELPLVLIIDELNVLGVPLDAMTANWLKSNFFSPQGRYLIFSTHVPMNVDEGVPFEGSRRMSMVAKIPTSLSVGDVRAIAPVCAEVTPGEIMLYGGLPALIYTVKLAKKFGDDPIKSRFGFFASNISTDQRPQFPTPGNRTRYIPPISLETVHRFLKEVLNGSRVSDANVMIFHGFGEVRDAHKIRYPLCFLKEVLAWYFKQLDANSKISVRDAVNTIHYLINDDLTVYAGQYQSGKDWEVLIQISILLRGILAVNNRKEFHPLLEKYVVIKGMCCCGLDCETLDQAGESIQEVIRKNPETLCVFSCRVATFPLFDGFVGYFDGISQEIIAGHQEKIGRKYPSGKIKVPTWVTKAFLMRGDVPNKSGESVDGKWQYLNAETIKERVLGYSLKFVYPSDWPDVEQTFE